MYLEKMKAIDIYFTPEYCKIYENNKEGESKLFVYEEDDRIICYPFLMRKINDLDISAVKSLDKEYFDIITPYGYGGPLTNVIEEMDKTKLFENFSKVFHEYCVSSGIVSEFVRFHPVIKNHAHYFAVEPTNIRNTVYIDLSNQNENVMDILPSKGRNRVKYAIKNGLEVIKQDTSSLEKFIEQYYASMDKNNADSYYYFTKDYFIDSVNLLKDHLTMFAVKYKDKIIASALFLNYNEYASYHLTGSDEEFLSFAPYNLLIYHAANYFKEKGSKYLHLGGGYSGDDNLLRFKKTMSRAPLLDFYIGRKIHILDIYKFLTKNLEVQDGFFPLYRHPSLFKNVLV